ARRRRNARADAGQLGVAGNADPVPAAGRARLRLLAPQIVVADRIAGGGEAFAEAGFVPDDARADLEGKLLGAHEIAQPDLLRIDADALRRHVHQALAHEGRGRAADAAVGSHGRLAGRDRAHAAVIGLDAIRAGHEAHDLHGLEARGPRIDRIGAHVAD